MAQFDKSTDQAQTGQLDSKIVNALWGRKRVVAGNSVDVEVWTHFVGSGSDIEVKVEDKDGRAVAQLQGKVYGDYFGMPVAVPEDARETLTFTAQLPKHGLSAKSGALTVIPPVKVTNLKWGKSQARQGENVKLSADVQGLPDGIEALIMIYEHDPDGANDIITKFVGRVKRGRIEAQWVFDPQADPGGIPSDEEMRRQGKPPYEPRYFFVIDVFGKRFGAGQESGFLSQAGKPGS